MRLFFVMRLLLWWDSSELCSSLRDCDSDSVYLLCFAVLSLAILSSLDSTANDFLFVSWESFGGSGYRLLMRLSFIAQETLTLPFDNCSFVFCLVNHMTQVLLADKMLSQVDLHLNSANADKMPGWVTKLCFKLLHTQKRGGSKRFLSPEGLISTPVTSCFLSSNVLLLSPPDLLRLLSTSSNGEPVPPIRQTNEKAVKLHGSDIYISLCFVHLECAVSKWVMGVSRMVLRQ